MATTAVERYLEKKAKQKEELEALRQDAISELSTLRSELKAELARLDKMYEKVAEKTVTGEPVSKKSVATGPRADFADVKELVAVLKKNGGRMNRAAINAAGYNLKSAIDLAKSDGKVFGYEQKRSQGSVWLK
jgi:hypothetical protein